MSGSNVGVPVAPSDKKQKTRDKKKASVSTFLRKLFDIVNKGLHPEIVAWVSDGKSFEIKSKEKFVTKILPVHFKHSNMNSFVRQLNMYDFHKVRRSSEEIIFQHPFFLKDRADLLVMIKRKTNASYMDSKQLKSSTANKLINLPKISENGTISLK